MQVQDIEDTPPCSRFFFFLRLLFEGLFRTAYRCSTRREPPIYVAFGGTTQKRYFLELLKAELQLGSEVGWWGILDKQPERSVCSFVGHGCQISRWDLEDSNRVTRWTKGKNMFSPEAMMQQPQAKTTDNPNICFFSNHVSHAHVMAPQWSIDLVERTVYTSSE